MATRIKFFAVIFVFASYQPMARADLASLCAELLRTLGIGIKVLPPEGKSPQPPTPSAPIARPEPVKKVETTKAPEFIEPTSDEYKLLLSDIKNFSVMKKIADLPGGRIVVAYGNPQNELTENEILGLHELLQTARRNKLLVIYDADAKSAPIIREAGLATLGISSSTQSLDGDIIRISNPYQKMRALLRIGVLVTNETSILGRALASESETFFYVGATAPWSDLNKSPQDLKKLLKNTANFHPLQPNFSRQLDEMSKEKKESFKREAASFLEKSKKAAVEKGAVFFGGKDPNPEVEKFAGEVATILAGRAYSISSGGATGVMESVNRAAKAVNALSIGVPVEKSEDDENERVVTDAHDLTVYVAGRRERIPILLANKNIVVIAPGKSGTRKEMNATLVDFASSSYTSRALVFFGEENRATYNALKAFPRFYSSRIWFLEKPEDILQVIGAEPAAGVNSPAE